MERRRKEDDDLEKRVADLAVGVIGLRGALEHVGEALKFDVESLRAEIDIQRKLSKYNRRTHFQMLYWVAFFAIHLAELRTKLPAEFADFLFWLTDDGGGWGWRLLGAITQITLFWVFWHRAQVPDDLYHRVPASLTRKRSLYNRIFGRTS